LLNKPVNNLDGVIISKTRYNICRLIRAGRSGLSLSVTDGNINSTVNMYNYLELLHGTIYTGSVQRAGRVCLCQSQSVTLSPQSIGTLIYSYSTVQYIQAQYSGQVASVIFSHSRWDYFHCQYVHLITGATLYNKYKLRTAGRSGLSLSVTVENMKSAVSTYTYLQLVHCTIYTGSVERAGRGCNCQSQSKTLSPLSVCIIIYSCSTLQFIQAQYSGQVGSPDGILSQSLTWSPLSICTLIYSYSTVQYIQAQYSGEFGSVIVSQSR
jgi:hypothetical protein